MEPRLWDGSPLNPGRTWREAVGAGNYYVLVYADVDGRRCEADYQGAYSIREAAWWAWQEFPSFRAAREIVAYRVLPGSRVGARLLQEVARFA